MVDDEPLAGLATVGQRLRAAREAKGLSIEDVASSTRIPTRHLQSIEDSEWDRLPASTYSVGFAKNYAGAVGLDRTEISDQLRAEMGSELPAHYTTAPSTDQFEPVDGNRSMPKGIVIGALVALVAIVLALTWLSNRDLQGNDAAAPAAVDAATPAPEPAASPQGPVVITANDAAWIEVRDGATILKQGELASGQSFEVPMTASAPVLTTAKPEALRISIGTGDAPAVGPAGTKVSNVSLRAADLMRGPSAAAAAPAPTPAPAEAMTPLVAPKKGAAKPSAAKPARRPTPRPATATTTAPPTPDPTTNAE